MVSNSSILSSVSSNGYPKRSNSISEVTYAYTGTFEGGAVGRSEGDGEGLKENLEKMMSSCTLETIMEISASSFLLTHNPHCMILDSSCTAQEHLHRSIQDISTWNNPYCDDLCKSIYSMDFCMIPNRGILLLE